MSKESIIALFLQSFIKDFTKLMIEAIFFFILEIFTTNVCLLLFILLISENFRNKPEIRDLQFEKHW